MKISNKRAILRLTQMRDYYGQLDMDDDPVDSEDPTLERETFEALNMAIEIMKHFPYWISVDSDEKPNINETILILFKSTKYIKGTNRIMKVRYKDVKPYLESGSLIVAWMHLPSWKGVSKWLNIS